LNVKKMEDRKIAAIIQARTGSTRLPSKVLMPIVGKPMLWHVIDRLKHCRNVDLIVVASTIKEDDKPVLELARESGAGSFAGSEEDVLDRYYQAAKKFNADIIVRITSDCPLIDPQIVDRLVTYFRNNKIDYVNTGPSFPEGVDSEVFSFAALETSWKRAKKRFEREHASMYIHGHPEEFKVARIENKTDMSYIRFTVDTMEDFVVVVKIFENLYKKGEVFHLQEIVDFLKGHPEITSINKDITRNEGFLSSLKKEGIDINSPDVPCRDWVSKYILPKKEKQETKK
jgi:spore coat polysaccharide biosynthesis protein SpsF